MIKFNKMSIQFPRSVDGLNSVNSDFINNSFDIYTNNLTISGNLISPITDNLSISTNLINTKL